MIYFDHSATTPMDERALDVLKEANVKMYGNSNSLHDVGGLAAQLIENSRRRIARLLNVPNHRIFFTNSGTESNVLAIVQIALASCKKEIIISKGEHASCDSAVDYLARHGYTIHSVPFRTDGIIDMDILEKKMNENIGMMIVQHVNPELGTIQPIEQIAKIAKKYDALIHCDLVQSFGKIDISPIIPYIDSASVSSHKVGGPIGVGAVYIREHVRFEPLFQGFPVEGGFRGGTLDAPSIASFATAATFAIEEREDFKKQANALHKQLIDQLKRMIPAHHLTIYGENTIPHIIGLGIYPIEGQLLMLRLNEKGFAISTGSACQVGMQVASKAMYAIDASPDRAKEFVRISFGKSTTVKDVKALAETIHSIYTEHVTMVK
ncbi:cysteine desulfurase family protein [Savagea faecisuis]|uniref:Cysteine desulfurase family protein n=1 Tax=Savagea faecisuis TaxID=1274803 RepID=A0ABW3GUY7_9BACL